MKKNIIYGIIALVVLGAIGFTMLPQESMVVENDPLIVDDISTTSASSESSSGTKTTTTKKTTSVTKAVPKNVYVVTYTSKGFTPSELQIPKGATVKFVNKTNTSMRIFASDSVKPPYSDLNQPKALGLNGEYVFNFVYSGVWAYYNSLKPSDTANIVVY